MNKMLIHLKALHPAAILSSYGSAVVKSTHLKWENQNSTVLIKTINTITPLERTQAFKIHCYCTLHDLGLSRFMLMIQEAPIIVTQQQTKDSFNLVVNENYSN